MELIDVSNVNGPVAWPHVRQAGIGGVWLKATEGETYTDQFFASNRVRANAAGLRVGAYHFARPDNNTPIAEARHFCAVVGKVGRRDLRPVLDLEKKCNLHPRELEAWARKFNQAVVDRLGVLPALYTYLDYINTDLAGLVSPIGNGLWLAAYGPNDGGPHPVAVPKPWKRLIAHQYSSRGHVPGVSGEVDRSFAPRLTGVLAHPVLGLL